MRAGERGGEGGGDKYFIRAACFEIRADCEQIMAGIRVVGKAARGRDASPGETKTPRANSHRSAKAHFATPHKPTMSSLRRQLRAGSSICAVQVARTSRVDLARAAASATRQKANARLKMRGGVNVGATNRTAAATVEGSWLRGAGCNLARKTGRFPARRDKRSGRSGWGSASPREAPRRYSGLETSTSVRGHERTGRKRNSTRRCFYMQVLKARRRRRRRWRRWRRRRWRRRRRRRVCSSRGLQSSPNLWAP